jgi:transcriptional regulator with XRE-family HTH domain
MKSFKNLKDKARENEVIREYLDSFQSQLGKEIFKLRVNRNLTQKELSELAKVTQATISRIEAGDPGIKGETYDKVLKALRAPKINLQGEEEQAAYREEKKLVLV